MDCTYGSADGCDGGTPRAAMGYTIDEGGLCSEEEYPYEDADLKSCQANTCNKLFNNITAYNKVTHGSESDLLVAVASQPTAVCIDADGKGFTYYSSGVYDGQCGTDIDHCVLNVGYGEQNGLDYWKIKNSWGTDWGTAGYMLMCRDCNKNGDAGECGINNCGTTPQI